MGQLSRQSEQELDGHLAATAAARSSTCDDPSERGYGPFAMLPYDCLSHVLRLLAYGPPFSTNPSGLTPVPTPHDLMAAMGVCRSWAEVVVTDDALWREVTLATWRLPRRPPPLPPGLNALSPELLELEEAPGGLPVHPPGRPPGGYSSHTASAVGAHLGNSAAPEQSPDSPAARDFKAALARYERVQKRYQSL
ncbi:hypothetical protein T492DRAFT_835469 [Pavlovales sp. CCMP2436]|nr:hypothetical protein T492DRAFT_835469 [Pavlovales sp. CCMP2436]